MELQIGNESEFSPFKERSIDQWINTSFYGAIVHKSSFDKFNHHNYDIIGMSSEGSSSRKSPETAPSMIEERMSLIEECDDDKSIAIQVRNDSGTTGENENSYELCKSCTARFTHNRTTRWFRIVWLLLTIFALSVSFFPIGLFSIVLLFFIPSQYKRPTCKMCEKSVWGF